MIQNLLTDWNFECTLRALLLLWIFHFSAALSFDELSVESSYEKHIEVQRMEIGEQARKEAETNAIKHYLPVGLEMM